ncbi:MAG TPA: acetoacetate--CoA ligase [Candidatus Acidoferrales bacterium]|nr:acetoacetate--CoA ligase [Candidatus Acidoferrales bacterium]
MGQLLWTPSRERVNRSNMLAFIKFVNERYGIRLESYRELHKWSVQAIPDFWAAMWEYSGVISSRGYDQVVDDITKFPGAKWFVGARLNFAENLLRHRDERVAFVFRGEERKTEEVTYAALYDRVARLAFSLREMGVRSGDRVCAYMPNIIQTPIAMLAATSLGALWTSCGAELGPTAVLDRFEQIEPKVLFTADGYFYKNRVFDTLSNARKVADGIPSIEKVVLVSNVGNEPRTEEIPRAVPFDYFLSTKPTDFQFEQLPFDHPVYIMFSSGTTGKPKCMVQGAGVLLNHLKELILHADLNANDRITYISSPSWMMWNWLMSSLAVGPTVVLYDGNPNYPDWGRMWQLVQEEKITIFGCSASYINYLRSVDAKPGRTYDLSSLREISQTGSPLSPEGFEWVYNEIKQDLHVNSISGGTDINGCFAGGSPTLPVYAGELQGPCLGMKVEAYDENGNAILDQEGELVCEAPSPSMPLYFWNDKNNEKYKEAYFTYYTTAGKNVWRHGDYIVIHSDTGGITFLGRSDSVLKPSGVRIGTAEIYSTVERFPEIADSLVIGQNWKDDQRVILFVQLSPGNRLTEDLKARIRKALRENASPRHVPALILEAPAIPYTFNMKKVESAVRNIINGRPISNRDALSNPESLNYFEAIRSELQK